MQRALSVRPGAWGNLLLASVALVTVLATAAAGREPKAIISGPRYAEPGEDVFLDFSQSEGEPDRFHVSIRPELAGRSQLEMLAGGTRARVKTYPGVWHVRLIVSNEDGWSEHTHTITIPGNPPCPCPAPAPGPVDPLPNPPLPPDPTPGPTPTPRPDPRPLLPVPQELSAIRGQVTTAARSINSQNRTADITKLVSVCVQLENDATRPNPETNPQHYIDALGNAISSLGAAWRPFLTAVGEKLRAHYLAGDLKSVDRWAVLCQEARLGLEAAK